MTSSESFTDTLSITSAQSGGIIRRISVRFGGSKPRELERFIKFFVVGMIGLTIDLTMTNLMLQFVFKPQPNNELPAQIANGIGFTLAVISNFILNRFWTYPDSRSRSIVLQLGQFFIVNILGLLIREVIVTVLHGPVTNTVKSVLGTVMAASLQERIGYNLALMTAIAIVMLWNFFVNRYWTYNDVK